LQKSPIPSKLSRIPINPSQTPRVLFFDHTAKLGGGEIALLNLVKNLNRDRFTPIVLLGAQGPLVQRLSDAGIETHVLPLSGDVAETRKDAIGAGALLNLKKIFGVLKYAKNLARFIRENRIDLVHTNSLKSDILGGIAARRAHVPVVWHVRDRIARDYLPGPVVRIFRVLCRIIPNQIIVNSNATALTLVSDPGRHGGRIHVVHDGTDVNPIPPATSASTNPNQPLIGLVGRISPWKGQHIFLESAAIVAKKFPAAKFQIIGSPLFSEQEYEAQLRQQVIRLGIESRVEFTGFRTDVADLIARLDLLVHASTLGEPFGQVVIEAMSAGKPVVATSGGGVPEIVVDGQTGILVPMSDAPAMAAAIEKILGNPDLASQMGAAGHCRVVGKFSIQRTAQGVEDVLAGMLNPTAG
jgi:glycosyltransferase involved in cell wall biosynthesis